MKMQANTRCLKNRDLTVMENQLWQCAEKRGFCSLKGPSIAMRDRPLASFAFLSGGGESHPMLGERFAKDAGLSILVLGDSMSA